MKKPKIAVIGSLNMDIVIDLDRMPLVGETTLGNNVSFLPGGKGANQAIAGARLGAEVSMIGALGNDQFGRKLTENLSKNGVDVSGLKCVNDTPTGIASIYLQDGNNSIVVVPGANSKITPEDIDIQIEKIASADIVLLQLEIPINTVVYAAHQAKRLGKTVILNPAPAQPLPDEIFPHIDYFTPNQTELVQYSGVDSGNEKIENLLSKVKNLGVNHVLTTLGSKGSAYLADDGTVKYKQGYNVPVRDTTGAGDCYNAGLAYALANGSNLENAIEYATLASALTVTKFGAQEGMPVKEEVLQFREQIDKNQKKF